MSQIGNKPKFEGLTPEDIDFIQIINENVTSGNALPFDLPTEAVLRIIVRSLKWFWAWHGDATQESTLYVPHSEIVAKAQTSTRGQIDIKLPDGIEGIFDLKQVGGISATGMGKNLKFPIMNAYRQSYTTNSAEAGAFGSQGAGFRGGYGNSTYSINDVVLQMYEVSQFQTLFQRGYRFSFNKNSQILRLMTGNVAHGFVCQAFERMSPQIMYGDQLFEDYVTAKVEQAIGRIVTTYDFTLPGGVKINFEEIKAEGKEKADQIEEEIKNQNNSDIMLTA